MHVLELRGVSKRLGRRMVVEDLNMTVEAGEVYGFLGPNGAGKTTTIRMIVGLIRPTAGEIRILGHDVQRDPVRALAHVGAIVENPELYSYLTGRQNLIHYARLAGVNDIARRVERVAERVGLADRLDEKVKRYSLGMRQRLGVAQALIADPKLLVLDEPTNGLDPAGMREFRELIRALAREGMAVFVSSHLLAEVEQMCDKVAVLRGGRVIAEARIADLTASVGHVWLRVSRPDMAQAVLRNSGWEVARDGGRLRVAAKDEAAIAAVVRALVEQGIDVYEVAPGGGLEQSFLALTGESPAHAAGMA
ncbi:putative ABC transporter ATP-binding protein YhcH [Alicyclobacillus cellulosilyticus]|uniref:ABC transporter ATP-binding protein YhcH n=1 Tax=Alicyclobacillus cellulosilyticus TaxID=1003997 RepID=A0A917NMG2_9BACL|nr:ABC transporter ATP-binding protein [Alicyclobacillus cellulosilyticus]GGJ11754.1 putative ABC transporter ATP-binding protein YhcH [Alicyclobacillus cellulosilyticus]